MWVPMNSSDFFSSVHGGEVELKQKRQKVVRNYFPLLNTPMEIYLYIIITLYDLATFVSVIPRILSGRSHIM